MNATYLATFHALILNHHVKQMERFFFLHFLIEKPMTITHRNTHFVAFKRNTFLLSVCLC